MAFSLDSLRAEMARLRRELAETAHTAARVLGVGGPYQVVPYRGYGNTRTVLVQGRAPQDEGIAAPAATDSAWRNLLNTFKRVESDPSRTRASA